MARPSLGLVVTPTHQCSPEAMGAANKERLPFKAVSQRQQYPAASSKENQLCHHGPTKPLPLRVVLIPLIQPSVSVSPSPPSA